MEAMRSGILVIAPSVVGIAEGIGNRGNGILLSSNPLPQDFANAIYDNIEFFKNKNTRIDRKEKWETMYSAHKNHHEFVNMLRNEIYGIL
jgi:glycogen synthase